MPRIGCIQSRDIGRRTIARVDDLLLRAPAETRIAVCHRKPTRFLSASTSTASKHPGTLIEGHERPADLSAAAPHHSSKSRHSQGRQRQMLVCEPVH
jgi:hypothetical protein